VFSSHIHSDHCHPRTLALLKDQIGQVLLPAERPGLRARYEGLGFRDIRLLENGRTLRLADDLDVTSFWSDPVDSVLVVQSGGTVVLHQNDCVLDDATTRRIGERFRIDYAFMCYTASGDLYPLVLDRAPAELEELVRAREEEAFRSALARIDAWAPAAVVPYAMALAYFQPDQLRLNGYGRFVPQEFCDRLRAARPEAEAFVLQPGDVLDTTTEKIARAGAVDRWGADAGEYVANVAEYAHAHAGELPGFAYGDPAAAAPRLARHVETRLRTQPIPHHWRRKRFAVHVVGDSPHARVTLTVDPDARTVEATALATPPTLEVTMPASIADVIVAGGYDPFMLLYSYRVTFRGRGPVDLSPRKEAELYCLFFLTLFAPEALNQI
jgi:UDP-MurNAc hydroxylase